VGEPGNLLRPTIRCRKTAVVVLRGFLADRRKLVPLLPRQCLELADRDIERVGYILLLYSSLIGFCGATDQTLETVHVV
jgi:hypothetical protein